jgi:aryl-alcohol dehydrogenase-like predicted oxidoreductase
MAELRDEGKVRAIGLSNHDVSQVEHAEKIAHVDSVQPPLSMINRSQADEIAWCARNGTGVIVYSPMHSGLLTGKFSRERVASLPEDDWRRHSRDFTTDLDRNLPSRRLCVQSPTGAALPRPPSQRPGRSPGRA